MRKSSRGFAGCCLAALFLLLGPIPAGATPKLEEGLEAQAQLLGVLETHLGELPDGEVSKERIAELGGMLAKMKELTGGGSLLGEDLGGIEREIRGYAGGIAAYREEYLQWVRLAAVGEKYPELVTVSGRRYAEVVVRQVTEVGLEIRHADGSARLRHDVLPAEFQERFQWNPEAARARLEREATFTSRAKRRAWIAARRAEIAAQTRADEAARRAWQAIQESGDEPVPFESRIDSPEPIEARRVDSPDPIEPLAVYSPDPIEPLAIDSPDPIEPREVHSPNPIEPLPVHSPGKIVTGKIHSPASIKPRRLHSPGKVRARRLHSLRGLKRMKLHSSGKLR